MAADEAWPTKADHQAFLAELLKMPKSKRKAAVKARFYGKPNGYYHHNSFNEYVANHYLLSAAREQGE